jgi:hypothetical protein
MEFLLGCVFVYLFIGIIRASNKSFDCWYVLYKGFYSFNYFNNFTLTLKGVFSLNAFTSLISSISIATIFLSLLVFSTLSIQYYFFDFNNQQLIEKLTSQYFIYFAVSIFLLLIVYFIHSSFSEFFIPNFITFLIIDIAFFWLTFLSIVDGYYFQSLILFGFYILFIKLFRYNRKNSNSLQNNT